MQTVSLTRLISLLGMILFIKGRRKSKLLHLSAAATLGITLSLSSLATAQQNFEFNEEQALKHKLPNSISKARPYVDVLFYAVRDIDPQAIIPGSPNLADYDRYYLNTSTDQTYFAHVAVIVPSKIEVEESLRHYRGEEPFPLGSILGKVIPSDQSSFYSSLKEAEEPFSQKDASRPILFVHGFHFNFSDAIKSAAYLEDQVSLGAVVAFTWAANPNADRFPFNYSDAEDMEKKIRKNYLPGLVHLIIEQSGKYPNLIAHSLGARLYFESYIDYISGKIKYDAKLNDVVLAAADIAVKDASAWNPRIDPQYAKRSYSYCSSSDMALEASFGYHRMVDHRLGLCVGAPSFVPMMNSIKVDRLPSDQYGHNYLFMSAVMSDDISFLLSNEPTPGARGYRELPLHRD